MDASFFWDEGAFAIISGIERSLKRLDLDCQAQFISVTNALEVQFESGDPLPTVVRLLSDALLTVAEARGVDVKKMQLAKKLDRLNDRIRQR